MSILNKRLSATVFSALGIKQWSSYVLLCRFQPLSSPSLMRSWCSTEGLSIRCNLISITGYGPIDRFMHQVAPIIPHVKSYEFRDLYFGINVLNKDSVVLLSSFGRYYVEILSGDNDVGILPRNLIKSLPCPVVYNIEFTHRDKQSNNHLEAISIMRTIVRAGRIGLKRIERRQAFFASAGVQMNGYSAYDAYRFSRFE